LLLQIIVTVYLVCATARLSTS